MAKVVLDPIGSPKERALDAETFAAQHAHVASLNAALQAKRDRHVVGRPGADVEPCQEPEPLLGEGGGQCLESRIHRLARLGQPRFYVRHSARS